jgi:hypothetical protein
MVLAVIGLLIALGGCIGAWSFKDDVTTAVVSGLDAAVKVAALGEKATAQSSLVIGQVGSGLSSVQSGLAQGVERRQENIAAVVSTANERYGPAVTRTVETVTATRDAIVAFNESLVAINRIPGIEVPTLTAELDAVQAQVDTVVTRIDGIRQTVADILPDGTPIQDAVGQTAAAAATASASLQDYSTRLGTAKEQATAASATAPRAINTLVWLLTLLLLLWAAGQVSLFIHALEWFRRPNSAAA